MTKILDRVYRSFCILVFLAVFSEIFFEFVPTEKYLQLAHPTSFITIAVFSVIFAICFRRIKLSGYKNFRRSGKVISHRWLVITTLCAHIAFSCMIYVFTLSTGPYYASIFFGAQVQHTMIVDRLNPNNDRKFCLSGVFVKDKPYFANEVCDINQEVLAHIRPNSTIRVSGRGTWMGVTPQHVALITND